MQPPEVVSVRKLIECLSMFSDDLPVVALYDCRCAGGSVVSVEIGPGMDHPGEAVMLVIE